jgi:AP-3 complex subunit delta-1
VKYVALLAFNKIVATHPFLVSQQEDVILECIDSPDITIRIQALDLVQGMVDGDSLVSVVSRLMRQLKMSAPAKDQNPSDVAAEAILDSDEEIQITGSSVNQAGNQTLVLPEDYRIDVIGRILTMCSRDNYSNVLDFDWYIDVLTQLVRLAPISRATLADLRQSVQGFSADISERIGDELRNVAVKVKVMRSTVVMASEIILAHITADTPAGHPVSSRALKSVTWILGEYASQLSSVDDSLNGLLQLLSRLSLADVTATALQAIAKIFAHLSGDELASWTSERKSRISLLMARIINAVEPLGLHPDLEVQGRAVEFTELLKLTAEAASSQPASTDESREDPPLLLTQAIPSLFNGWELNSVAPQAQLNVPLPEGIDLNEPIHPNLNRLLSESNLAALVTDESEDFDVYYHQRPAPTSISSSSAPAISRLADPDEETVVSYQSASEDTYLDADIVARRKAERMERNRDDPFYIPSSQNTRTSTPIHNILQDNNGPDLDIDAIPIMQLELDNLTSTSAPSQRPPPQPLPRQKHKVVIAADETLDSSDGGAPRTYDSENNSDSFTKTRAKKLKQGLLQVDSSNIGSFHLEGSGPAAGYDYEAQQREEAEMQQAMKEVERLRLEMQRANERIQVAQGVDAQGTVIKKKKKKAVAATGQMDEGAAVKPKKKKKTKEAAAVTVDEAGKEIPAEDNRVDALGETAGEVIAPKKKKKKKKVAEIQDDA